MRMAEYMDVLRRKSYLDLMKERERLLFLMHRFEAEEMAGTRENTGGAVQGGRYQVYFDALSVLCGVMRERYRLEYASGRRCLKADAWAETEKKEEYGEAG